MLRCAWCVLMMMPGRASLLSSPLVASLLQLAWYLMLLEFLLRRITPLAIAAALASSSTHVIMQKQYSALTNILHVCTTLTMLCCRFVDQLAHAGVLKTPNLINTMRDNLDRWNYGPVESPVQPEPIGYSQTMSAWDIHAMATEALYPALMRPNASILDVGCGSGYLTALFARLNPSATVYGVDCIPELVELSRTNISKKVTSTYSLIYLVLTLAQDIELLDSRRVVLEIADASKGYSKGAPYDAIHVGAATDHVPKELLRQLKVEGLMVAPVGPLQIGQNFVLFHREDAGIDDLAFSRRSLATVRFVPLVTTENAEQL